MSSESRHTGSRQPKTESPPRTIINRESEWDSIESIVAKPGSGNIHLHGPRGTGKTLIAQRAIDALQGSASAFYIPCTIYDTQYQVLKKISEQISNKRIPGGYHTSQLQQNLQDKLENHKIVITLDEVDFLLLNDGSDLLYYLTRSGIESISIVTISSNIQDISNNLDDRTYSSLHPQNTQFENYTESEATQIIYRQAGRALERIEVSEGALARITSQTTNIRHALHWLSVALKHCGSGLTPDCVDETKTAGLNRYWDTLLAEFTAHHHLLRDVILDLTSDVTETYTGEINERYIQSCRENGIEPLTTRRISDYLKHLELLGIIQADYHYGGKEGKTREIQLKQI